MALLPSSAIPSASGGGYTIDQSLRFNDDDSAYLSWTPSSAGTRTIWTFSCWVKRGNLGTTQPLFNAQSSSDEAVYFRFDSGDVLRAYEVNGGSTTWRLITTPLYRDPSAWMNVVIKYDSTNGTSGDRVQIYVNGEEITSFSEESQPSSSFASEMSNTVVHQIGANTAGSQYLDGYLSEVHFIDGTAYDADDFGEEGDYGEWKAKSFEGTYGDNGFYLPFNTVNDTIIAATGGTIYTSGDYKYHKFTADGTFTVTSTQGASVVDALVIAGGGGGGGDNGGGGGAGGYRFVEEHSVSATAYSITVGDGGAGSGSSDAANGDNSVFSSITATGGGFGGTNNKTHTGADGGSGGGGAGGTYGTEGSGTSGQGNDGGTPLRHSDKTGGGGGGALEAGNTDGQGAGGDGSNAQSAWATITSSGDSGYYAGGGSGGHEGSSGAIVGGTGGGGSGRGSGVVETAGDANTGGGGGGGASGAAGGSGIVIIRYKYQ